MTSGNALIIPALILTLSVLHTPCMGDETRNRNLSAALGLNINKGNTENTLKTMQISWEKEHNKFIFLTAVKASSGEAKVENDDGTSDTEITADNADGKVNCKYRMNGHYTYANISAMYDNLAEIDYRTTTGLGIGYYIMKTEKNSLNIDIGAGHLWEKIKNAPDEYPVFRVSENYQHKISANSKILQSVEYLPKAADFNTFLLNSEIAAEASINSTIALRITLSNAYDNEPANDKDKNDLSFITSLVWSH